jgi:hypothetical protein
MVQMAEEDRRLDGIARLMGASSQGSAQPNQAGAGIENDGLTIGVDFDAGSVAAEADRIGAWSRVAAAHSPEFDGDWVVFHTDLLAI